MLVDLRALLVRLTARSFGVRSHTGRQQSASGGWILKADDRVFHVKLIRTLTVTRRDEERSWVAMRMMLTLDCVPIYCLEMSAARRIGDSVGL